MTESTKVAGIETLSFTGHDTFPLRHGWLEKAFLEVENNEGNPFTADDAIVKFGVGKNMVNAIKHWALATNFIVKSDKGFTTSDYAKAISLSDPYLEKIATIWKLHYEMCKNLSNTSIYWIFSHLNVPTFSRDYLEIKLQEFALEKNKQPPAEKTLKTDINVFLSMYCKVNPIGEVQEDDISCPFHDLNLIRKTEDSRYTLNSGYKKS